MPNTQKDAEIRLNFDATHTYSTSDFPLLNPYLYRSLGKEMMDLTITKYLKVMNNDSITLNQRMEAFEAAKYTESFAQSYYAGSHQKLEIELDRPLSKDEKTQHNRIKNAASNDVLVKMANTTPPDWLATEDAGSWNDYAAAKKKSSGVKRSLAAKAREAKKRKLKI